MRTLSRREFISLLFKVFAGGLLSFLFGKLVLGKRIDFSSWETCSKDGYCTGCPETPACRLPQALSYRRIRSAAPVRDASGTTGNPGNRADGRGTGGTEAGA